MPTVNAPELYSPVAEAGFELPKLPAVNRVVSLFLKNSTVPEGVQPEPVTLAVKDMDCARLRVAGFGVIEVMLTDVLPVDPTVGVGVAVGAGAVMEFVGVAVATAGVNVGFEGVTVDEVTVKATGLVTLAPDSCLKHICHVPAARFTGPDVNPIKPVGPEALLAAFITDVFCEQGIPDAPVVPATKLNVVLGVAPNAKTFTKVPPAPDCANVPSEYLEYPTTADGDPVIADEEGEGVEEAAGDTLNPSLTVTIPIASTLTLFEFPKPPMPIITGFLTVPYATSKVTRVAVLLTKFMPEGRFFSLIIILDTPHTAFCLYVLPGTVNSTSKPERGFVAQPAGLTCDIALDLVFFSMLTTSKMAWLYVCV